MYNKYLLVHFIIIVVEALITEKLCLTVHLLLHFNLRQTHNVYFSMIVGINNMNNE